MPRMKCTPSTRALFFTMQEEGDKSIPEMCEVVDISTITFYGWMRKGEEELRLRYDADKCKRCFGNTVESDGSDCIACEGSGRIPAFDDHSRDPFVLFYEGVMLARQKLVSRHETSVGDAGTKRQVTYRRQYKLSGKKGKKEKVLVGLTEIDSPPNYLASIAFLKYKLGLWREVIQVEGDVGHTHIHTLEEHGGDTKVLDMSSMIERFRPETRAMILEDIDRITAEEKRIRAERGSRWKEDKGTKETKQIQEGVVDISGHKEKEPDE